VASSKLALCAALLAVGFGAQAQTIETHYPVVIDNYQRSLAPEPIASGMPWAAPALVQSNFEGVKPAPGYEATSTLTREEVRAGAEVRVPLITGHNA
jgi:hypothetical protein